MTTTQIVSTEPTFRAIAALSFTSRGASRLSRRCRPRRAGPHRLYFTATWWTGEPVNAEPGKCSEIGWHDMTSLPPGIVSYISTALHACARNDAFSLDRW